MTARQRNWRRIGVQLGLLAGVGLAFTLGGRDDAVAGDQDQCPQEGMCWWWKPNFLFIVDYSTSMNAVWDLDENLTRWEVASATIKQIATPGGFFSQNSHLALMRFGHDPDPESEGTTIPNDSSGLVDGHALDVAWDDANHQWYECAGQMIVDALDATPPPLMGAQSGISAWTKGALDRAAQEIAQTKADHPEDADGVFPRLYANVILTQGSWTGPDGLTTLAPASENPAITVLDLWENHEVSTYVVGFAGDQQSQLALEDLAGAGGTAEPIAGGDVDLLELVLQQVVQNSFTTIAFECHGGLPRVMILLDASSAMLNVDGMAGAMGQTGWDQAREALVGRNSLFDVALETGTIADYGHFGLAVFGHDVPGEQRLLVQYGPCMKDNFAWALDPQTSCAMPGCDDPWGGPPIAWTFVDGSQEPPGFDLPTHSHMPKCDGETLCSGSGAYLHLGLQLIKENQVEYQMAGMLPQAPYPTTPETQYLNILITEGRYDGYSTDAQVQAELEAMHSSGITTHVIGLGDGVDTPQAVAQLENMASWGSGGTEDHYDANNQAELEAVLVNIFSNLTLDPCCAVNDCSHNPEPTTNEPDPIPETGDGDGDGDGDGGDDPTGDGDGDGDPSTTGDGDGDGDGGSPTDSGDGDSEDTGESGDPSSTLNDRGCSCQAEPGSDSRDLLGAGVLLLLLRRTRRREQRSA